MDELQVMFAVYAISMIGMMLMVIVILFQQGVKPADEKLTSDLQKWQENPEHMRHAEEMYSKSSEMAQTTLRAITEVLRLVAPRTALGSDDAAVRLLDDLMTPGPPVDEDTIQIRDGEVLKG